MTSSNNSLIETSYRAYYGKLFASLLNQFGSRYLSQIEDSLQNAFYKSLKNWKPGSSPENKLNWLYIVARNDLINRIKKDNNYYLNPETTDEKEEDLRLQTILFLSGFRSVSYQAKVIFTLRNVFGLNIKEVSDSLLISEDAIYKSNNRTKKAFQLGADKDVLKQIFRLTTKKEIGAVEEILYAVFNIGFDSFDEKTNSITNEDLCLEAIALAKLLSKMFNQTSTRNLIALFCLHASRIPAKTNRQGFVPFFDQDRTQWNQELMSLGFNYLKKPKTFNKYYLEAVITGKYMTETTFDNRFWEEIITLYQLLVKHTNSPIVKLNLAYCLFKINQPEQALKLLDKIKTELPDDHLYYSLVKAEILKTTDHKESNRLVNKALSNIQQKVRKDYLLENWLFK